MNTLKFFALAGGLCLLAACSGDTAATQESKESTRQAHSSPSTTVSLAADFELKAYKGKVVLLNFWATWCGPCAIEIPDLVKLHSTFDKDKVAIIGISLDRNGTSKQLQGLLKEFAAHYKITYPLVLDDEGKLHQQFGAFAGIPTTFLIDQEGKIRKTYTGIRSFETFTEDISSLLNPS